jgi:predicted short-subunit dehydrogenase-like oxidoreductase (DUF2520 family)
MANAAGAFQRIGFIGAGRVGSALSRALAAAGQRVVAVHSRSPGRSRALAATLPGCTAAASPQELADAADLVFLAVPDDAIAPLAASVRWRAGQAAVHCSGALGLEALHAATLQRAAAGAFHPLQLFADPADIDPETAARGLSRCAVAVEADAGLQEALEALALRLGARLMRVPRGGRAAYHAGSHYAAAFVCVLLAEGEAIFRRLGIDEDAAAWGLQALARGTLDAVERTSPARAMAGVYARGDAGTAARHVEALDALDPEAGALYRSLALRSVALALQAGRIDPSRAASLRGLLDH